MAYHLEYVENPSKLDEIVQQDGVKVLIESKALFTMIGSEMDWQEDKLQARFVFKNPNISKPVPLPGDQASMLIYLLRGTMRVRRIIHGLRVLLCMTSILAFVKHLLMLVLSITLHFEPQIDGIHNDCIHLYRSQFFLGPVKIFPIYSATPGSKSNTLASSINPSVTFATNAW